MSLSPLYYIVRSDYTSGKILCLPFKSIQLLYRPWLRSPNSIRIVV